MGWISPLTMKDRLVSIPLTVSYSPLQPTPLLPYPFPSPSAKSLGMQMCIITTKINWAQCRIAAKCVPLVIAFINFGSIFPENFYPGSPIARDNGADREGEREKIFVQSSFWVSQFVLKLFIGTVGKIYHRWRLWGKRHNGCCPLPSLGQPCFFPGSPQTLNYFRSQKSHSFFR